MNRPRFGAHCSIAGGHHHAFRLAREAGCECMQIFVKNQRQWRAGPLTEEGISLWNEARRGSGIEPVIGHGTYLINLASPDETLWRRSVVAFIDELIRCEQLGIRWHVTHAGAHRGAGTRAGIRRVVRALDEIERATRGCRVGTLLEVTAGQGSSIGGRLEEIAAILDGVRDAGRVGICLDTCHLFAAGHEIADPAGYRAMMEEVERLVGVRRVRCIHMNDSLQPKGSQADRHAHIGKGRIGRRGFANFINDPRLRQVPMILETPKGRDARGRDWDRLNLAALRRLAR